MLTKLHAWRRNTAASVAVQFALIVIPLVITIGLAIDGSRIFLVKYRFQTSLDAAALAIGTTFGSNEYLETVAKRYVDKNFQVPGAEVQSVKVSNSAEQVILTGSVQLETLFGAFLKRDYVKIDATTDVRRAGGGLMVALVLDNTGSMWSSAGSKSRIEGLRAAALSLTAQLFQGEDAEDEVRIAVVPYTAMVNPGPAAPGLVDTGITAHFRVQDPQGLTGVKGADLEVLSYAPTDKTQWKGCVYERSGDASIDDTPPGGVNNWKPLIWPIYNDNQYGVYKSKGSKGEIDPATVDPGGNKNANSFTGPNVGCPTPILPLTNNEDDVNDALNAMTAWNRGGTLSDIGMAWGIRVLSPTAPFTESKTTIDKKTGEAIWESPRWRRAIVLMTDGDNVVYNAGNEGTRVKAGTEKSDITGYGRLGEQQMNDLFQSSNSGTVKTKVDNRLQALCDTAKALDIIVYTVVFSNSTNAATRAIYETCASDKGKYWYAPSADALDSAFGAIGSDLNKLRITK
ncbi:MAG: pilus assembly protein TadG-related protein [Pannonibacter sp.]